MAALVMAMYILEVKSDRTFEEESCAEVAHGHPLPFVCPVALNRAVPVPTYKRHEQTGTGVRLNTDLSLTVSHYITHLVLHLGMHTNLRSATLFLLQVMANLEAILNKAALTFDNVVKTTVLLADMGDFAAVNAIYGAYMRVHISCLDTMRNHCRVCHRIVAVDSNKWHLRSVVPFKHSG
jgi:enamine deaminase RidA (YjgF/YER057c/UK114 family)